jgi:hypothetical protein
MDVFLSDVKLILSMVAQMVVMGAGVEMLLLRQSIILTHLLILGISNTFLLKMDDQEWESNVLEQMDKT